MLRIEPAPTIVAGPALLEALAKPRGTDWQSARIQIDRAAPRFSVARVELDGHLVGFASYCVWS